TVYRQVPLGIYQAYLKRTRRQYDEPHLICWNYYNQQILQIVDSVAPEDVIVIEGSQLNGLDTHLRAAMSEQWHLETNGPSLAQLHQPSTLTSRATLQDIDARVLDETRAILAKLHARCSFKDRQTITGS
ncbi:MAG: hypothetical protein R3330_13020, partial [Saprospiraceae bacterium]|nr:hypothetical protein [Saprospiraceae bacterium]